MRPAPGYNGITPSECQQKGCCFVPSAPYIGSATLDLPVCIFPNNGSSAYNLAGDLTAASACPSARPACPASAPRCSEALRGGRQSLAPAVQLYKLGVPRCASLVGCTPAVPKAHTTSAVEQRGARHAWSRAQPGAPARPAGGGPQTATLTQAAATLPQLGPDVSPLALTVEHTRADILRVKIGAQGRWEVPRSTFPANVSAGAGPCQTPPSPHQCTCPDCRSHASPPEALSRAGCHAC